MMEVTAGRVNELRGITGAPLMKCKAALLEAQGDLAQAARMLRERGIGTGPIPVAGNQGYIAVYSHNGGQIVSLVELASMTDFVARSVEFKTVAGELAMQVAASDTAMLSVEGLLAQPYIRDEKRTVGSLVEDLKLKVREGVYVRRIARWRVGEVL